MVFLQKQPDPVAAAIQRAGHRPVRRCSAKKVKV